MRKIVFPIIGSAACAATAAIVFGFHFESGGAAAAIMPGPTPDVATIAQLKSIIVSDAAAMGDPAAAVAYTSTTLAGASMVAGPGGASSETGSVPAYVLIAHGKFVGNYLRIPAGAQAPTGSVLVVTIRASDLSQASLSLSDHEPNLASGNQATPFN